MANWRRVGTRTVLLIGLACAAGCDDDEAPSCALSTCGDGGVCTPEECDDGNVLPGDGCSPTCMLEATGCQDCIYQGLTSQGRAFEVQVEGGGIKRIHFTAAATPVCSSPGSCPGAMELCIEIDFSSPTVACDFPTSGCTDCPSTSCNDVSGSVTYPTAQGEVEMSLEFPQGSGCFVSLEPDPVTWSALCSPGGTPTSCGSSRAADEIEMPILGGRARIIRRPQEPYKTTAR
jgi:cysteine-rich repeat protein